MSPSSPVRVLLSALLTLFCHMGSAYSDLNLEFVQKEMEEVIESFNKRDPSPLRAMIDPKIVFKKSIAGTNLDKKTSDDFLQGIISAAEKLGPQLIQFMPEHGYARLVSVRNDKNLVKALIRIDLGQQGYSFTDFYFQKINNEMKITDFYSYSAGMLWSEINQNLIVFTLKDESAISGFFRNLGLGGNNWETKRGQSLLEMVDAMRAQQHMKVVDIFKKLPKEYQKNKCLLMMALKSAGVTGKMDIYLELLSILHDHYKDDPRMVFMLLDYHFIMGKHEKVVESLNLLMKEIGVKDAALISLMANTLIQKEEFDEAIKLGLAAHKMEKDLENPYWVMAMALSAKGKFEEVSPYLTSLTTKFGYKFSPEDFKGNEFYGEFIESDAGKKWAKTIQTQ